MHPVTTSPFRKRLATLATLLFCTALPCTAFANDMGGLVFVVFIWPMAAALALLQLIFLAICIVRLSQGAKGAKPACIGRLAAIISVAAWFIFSGWTLFWLGGGRHSEMGLIHIVAFWVISLPCLATGLVLRHRALR